MEDLDTFLTTLSVMVDTLCKHHRLSLPKRPLPAPRLGGMVNVQTSFCHHFFQITIA
ncbi:MAG TPA: hypothetical protein VFN35_06895 [Ktedonobacteraceae bacterium]|nr:hypothetical protein [Ktedonobacteraceae bacterium]